jgi:cell division septation protein DedD
MGLGGISFRSIFLILFCVLLALSLWKTSPDLKKLLYRVAKIGSHEEPTSEEGQRIGKPAHIVNRMSVKIESPQETRSAPPAREEVSKVSRPAGEGSAAKSVSPTPPAPLMAQEKPPSDLAKQALPDATTSAPRKPYYSLHVGSFQSPANARNRASSLRQRGLRDVWWKKVTIPGKGRWYRVYVGKHQDREEALRHGRTLKAEGIIEEFFVHEVTEP